MKLYEIDRSIQEILDKTTNPETGEINDAMAPEELSELFFQLSDLEMARSQKIENIALMIKNLESDAKAIREEEKALAKRRSACETKAERLRDYLLFSGAENIETPRVKLTVRQGPEKAVIEDESELRMWGTSDNGDCNLFRFKDPEINRTWLLKALKEGREIPGAVIGRDTCLTIK